MEYMRSVQFIFDRKNWLTNVLLGGVCMLVPIVGPMVFMGYLFEVIDALKRDPEHKDYPDFDFNRLMDYLSRGVWPFLMQLVVGLIIGVPLVLVFGALSCLGAIVAGSSKTPEILVVFQLLAYALLFVGIIASIFVTFPAQLQAGLAREFNFSGMIAFVKDFNKRVFKELLISILFLVAIAIVAEFVGLALFCVGIYFTIAAVVMAQFHLKFQLYMLYLDRGGEPIIPAASTSQYAERPRREPKYPDEPEEPDERIQRGR
jgi:hypothetical protein